MDCSTPGSSVLQYLPEFAQIRITGSVMLSNQLILCHTLLLCLQSFPASGSLPMTQLFTSVAKVLCIASALVLPMNTQGWFPLGLTGLISFQSNGLSRVFYNITIWKHRFFNTQCSFWSNSHTYMPTGKIIPLMLHTDLHQQSDISTFNTLISWLQSPSTVILEPKKRKSVTAPPRSLLLFTMKWWSWMPGS